MCDNEKIENMEIPEEDLVYLTDDEGNEVAFEFIDYVELDSGEYVVLLPVDSNDGEVVILKFDGEGEDESENYVGVEDEETLAKVFAVFKERFSDVFQFEDDAE